MPLSILAAARKLNIPTVEIQHGLISPLNIAYRFPADCTKDNAIVPDYMFTFGTYWHSRMNRKTVPVAVGASFVEENTRTIKSGTKRNAHQIIVSSITWSSDALQSFVLGLSKLLPDYSILYKLRPAEYLHWRSFYSPEIQHANNIRVIDNNDIDNYTLLAESKYHLGINSTMIYEGLHLGCTTFILKHSWYEEMLPLTNNNQAFLISTPEEMAELIRSDQQPQPLDMRTIFKPDSLRNAQCSIDTFITTNTFGPRSLIDSTVDSDISKSQNQ